MIDSIVYSLYSFLYYLFFKLELFCTKQCKILDRRCSSYELRKWKGNDV